MTIMVQGVKLEKMEHIMRSVYGDWNTLPMFSRLTTRAEGCFPVPMPASEAGPSPTGQRRYLWTDAFGVLNFVTLAHRQSDAARKNSLLKAARSLIDAVHSCLGNPRGEGFAMAEDDFKIQDQNGILTSRFRGLRIGKAESLRKGTDPGMHYDGMYWHYIDKWIFALTRYGMVAEDPQAIRDAGLLIRQIHDAFVPKDADGNPIGIHWKLAADLQPISQLGRPMPTNDAVGAYLVYSLLANAAGEGDLPEGFPRYLNEARILVKQFFQSRYGRRVSDDPLGWGLALWEAQWLRHDNVVSLPSRSSILGSRLAHMFEISQEILNPANADALPFRYYGALLGARTFSASRPPSSGGDDKRGELTLQDIGAITEKVLESFVQLEITRGVGEPHSCINKVMFASVLDPWSFTRIESDPVVTI